MLLTIILCNIISYIIRAGAELRQAGALRLRPLRHRRRRRRQQTTATATAAATTTTTTTAAAATTTKIIIIIVVMIMIIIIILGRDALGGGAVRWRGGRGDSADAFCLFVCVLFVFIIVVSFS